jgi:hypothetical protein
MRSKIFFLLALIVCCIEARAQSTQFIVGLQSTASGYYPGALPSSAAGFAMVGNDIYFTDPINRVVFKRGAGGLLSIVAGILGTAGDGPYGQCH